MTRKWLALAWCAGVALPALAAVEADLPSYQPATGVAGNLSSIGSDSLNNLMTFWAEAFRQRHPAVNVQVQGAGSSTAPPALVQGTANFGPMSRPMKENEIQAFLHRHGYKPTAVPVAIDALAVFVNQDNPLPGLSLAQLDAAFSTTRLCGHAGPVATWGDIGLTGSWTGRDIQLFGRNSVSGTYGYFKEHALCKGDFKPGVNEQPGSASVVQSVSASLNGLGYSGLGYRTASVRVVPVQGRDGHFYDATAADALAGRYPLARPLLVYVNKHPHRPLPPLEAAFLRFVLSREGQEIVEKDGYIPLPAAEAGKIRQLLGL